jgi:pimeloyl-ACP methyl ester carboxylesterase
MPTPVVSTQTHALQTHTCQTHIWQWRGYPIRYQVAGEAGPAVLLIHGFGASSDHWRQNLPVLGQQQRVYALDLIGFGQSAKPTPTESLEYTFPTWAALVVEFCEQVIGEPVFLVGNSIGCVVALQAAVDAPGQVRGVAMLNCSLRLLHERKRITLPWYKRVGSVWLQQVLAYKPLGYFFFRQLAQAKTLRKILLQAYGRPTAVTDELVELLLAPARDPGAADVFLAFIRYAQGPLAEDLLPQVQCPVLILWGEADPWEPVALGQAYAQYPTVQDFRVLPGLGHCPQDDGPEIVNPILQAWIADFDGAH